MHSDRSFEGVLDIHHQDEVCVSTISTNAKKITKANPDADERVDDHHFVVLQVKGQSHFEQMGSGVTLEAGDVTVMDQRYPCMMEFDGMSEQISVQIPTHMMIDILGASCPSHAVNIQTRYGSGFALRNYLVHALNYSTRKSHSQLTVQNNLLTKLLGEALSIDKSFLSNEDSQSMRLTDVKSYAIKHIGNSELSMDDLAQNNALSRRQLYRLFGRESLTPNQWLKNLRLALASDLLLDKTQLDRSVADICYVCGFKDLAHFTRSFTSHFGAPPARYRKDKISR
ncbi:transcriptional regulator FeaR [Pseudoteredinibacter isoporae]